MYNICAVVWKLGLRIHVSTGIMDSFEPAASLPAACANAWNRMVTQLTSRISRQRPARDSISESYYATNMALSTLRVIFVRATFSAP